MVLVPGDALLMPGNEVTRSPSECARTFGIHRRPRRSGATARRSCLNSMTAHANFLYGRNIDQKRQILNRRVIVIISSEICGCNGEVADCFRAAPSGLRSWLRCVPAADLRDHGYSGRLRALAYASGWAGAFRALHLFMFPDGNASLARLMVPRSHSGVAAVPNQGRRRTGRFRLTIRLDGNRPDANSTRC